MPASMPDVSKPAARRTSFLHRLAWLCVATVLAVTTLSAFIRLSNAGLGCAPWPQCYGERGVRAVSATGAGARSDEVGATIAARLAHRVMAVVALLLIVLMLMVCFGERPRLGGAGAIAFALLALALFLAVLGRWSSGSRVPAVSIANLVGGFAMLALAARLAFGAAASLPARLHVAAVVTLLLLVVQIGFGGLVSASHAGLSCTDWLECAAAARDTPWSALDPFRAPVLSALPPFNAAGALSQTIHRGLAVALALALVLVAILAWRDGRGRVASALLALLAAQLTAGVAMAHGSIPLPVALLHNVIAACLLAMLVLLVRKPAGGSGWT